MKSICIKTNNKSIINYLLEEFKNISIENVFISLKDFSHFKNIILHCTDDSKIISFITSISNILTKSIITFNENKIITDSINLNYFYFNSTERNIILEQTQLLLYTSEDYIFKYDIINNNIFNYLSSNHSFYYSGYLNFRLPKYIEFINEKIDIAVNKFLIDKEYLEFIKILKIYIKSESSKNNINHLHLIYHNKTSIIVDDDNELVSCNDNITKAKYISDISFSSNDLALNTLLNLLPQKITVHLIDDYIDEFINTLKLIFENKIDICENCSICELYRYKEKNK